MDLKRLAEWLGSGDGLIKIITAAIASAGTLAAAITGLLKPLFRSLALPEITEPIITGVVLVALAFFLWRGYRHFARESRLEQPDRFTLIATTSESLIGRDDDLERLLHMVAQNRIVLLDGESGCGKSALVGSGLVPTLQSGDSLFPVLVRDWGDDSPCCIDRPLGRHRVR